MVELSRKRNKQNLSEVSWVYSGTKKEEERSDSRTNVLAKTEPKTEVSRRLKSGEKKSIS